LVKFLLISLLFFNGISSAQKINGVGFISNDKPISLENVSPIKKINANYEALNPFAFMMGLESTKITFNSKHQWYGETSDGIKQYAKMFRNNDIKTMLKPQIWIAFEKSYSDFFYIMQKLLRKLK